MARKSKTDQTDQAVELSPEEIAANEEAARLAAEAEAKLEAERAAELEFISAPFILSPEMGKASAPQRARDAAQLKMDETVNALHDTWVKAGRPSTWGAMVSAGTVATYFVNPEKVADHKRLITRATQLPDSGIRARWGKSYVVTEALAQRHNLPGDYVGREVVSFAIMDKRPRTTNGDTATAATSDAMLTDEQEFGGADQEQDRQDLGENYQP